MERSEAIAQGLSTYETGRPCKHGHIGKRYTQTATCVSCVRDNTKKWSAETGYSKQYYRENRAELSRKAAERYKKKKAREAIQFYEYNEKLRVAHCMLRLYFGGMHGDDQPELDFAAVLEAITKGPDEYVTAAAFWLQVQRKPDETQEAFRMRMVRAATEYYRKIKS